MTLALNNSYNGSLDKSVDLSEYMTKKQGTDFTKIFEKQTENKDFGLSQNNASKSDDFTKLENKAVETNTTTNTDEINSSNSQSAIKNNLITQSEAPEQEITVDDDMSDFQQDSTITELKTITDEKELTDENLEILIQEAEQNIIEEIITTDNTIITDEEPTMYNELNTLQDPTSLLLIQAQIQKTVTNSNENEQILTEVNENNLLKASGNSTETKNQTAIFKQFDSFSSNDVKSQIVQNALQKDNSSLKNDAVRTSNIINENIVKELNVEVIGSQAGDSESNMSNLMQNQSPQEQAARVMIQGDIKFEDTISETIKSAERFKPTEITPGKIIEQIAKQLDNMVNNSKLNLVLNPGSLGKVNLQIINSKDGLIAHFTVTSQEARDLLFKGLDGLKESLLAQGVNVDSVLVKLEETEGEYQSDYTEQEDSKGGNKQQGSKKQKENEKEFEQMMFELESEKKS